MPVVISEFEVLPGPSEKQAEAVVPSAEAAAKNVEAEIRQALELKAERELRVRAY